MNKAIVFLLGITQSIKENRLINTEITDQGYRRDGIRVKGERTDSDNLPMGVSKGNSSIPQSSLALLYFGVGSGE